MYSDYFFPLNQWLVLVWLPYMVVGTRGLGESLVQRCDESEYAADKGLCANCIYALQCSTVVGLRNSWQRCTVCVYQDSRSFPVMPRAETVVASQNDPSLFVNDSDFKVNTTKLKYGIMEA